MSDDLRPPARNLLSPEAVQPVNADALLNALVDMLISQTQIASLLQDVTDAFMSFDDREMQRLSMDARLKLTDIAISLTRTTESLKVLQRDVK